MKNISMRYIARKCGVSAATVSNALNNRQRIDAETKKRVLETARQLKYTPYKNRPWTRDRKTRLIGLVMPSTTAESNPFFSRAISSAKAETSEKGYNCVLYFDQEIFGQVTAGPFLGPAGVPCEGLIIFCPIPPWDNALRALKDQGVPCVLIRRETKVPGIPVVTDNDYQGARLAAEHLRRLGHTRIGLVTMGQGGSSVFKDRDRAYADYLHEQGLPRNPEWVLPGFELRATPRHERLHSIMAAPDRPTAFCCEDDDSAMNLIKALDELGLRVPADVAVVGYDNNYTAERFRPALTTVDVPVAEMVRLACGLLIDGTHPAGDRSSLVEKVRIEVKNRLVIRESCGQKATTNPSSALRAG